MPAEIGNEKLCGSHLRHCDDVGELLPQRLLDHRQTRRVDHAERPAALIGDVQNRTVVRQSGSARSAMLRNEAQLGHSELTAAMQLTGKDRCQKQRRTTKARKSHLMFRSIQRVRAVPFRKQQVHKR